MQALDNYIKKIKTLPPSPRVLARLLVLLNEADGHASEIVDLIAFDPALTAKVLQRCNNAASGLAGTVTHLDQAVTLVGFDAIYRLVAMVVGEGVLSAKQPGYGIGTGELWEHSITTAVAARVIARQLGGDENLAFTAGLLHDIGKLVLSSYLEDCQESVVRDTQHSGRSFLEAEQTALGVDHAEIGGLVLEEWSFPENLVKAVRYHHDPPQARPHEQLAASVHLGDIIAHFVGQAQGIDSFAVRTQSEALEILEISPVELDTLIIDTDSALKECAGLIPTAS
jgi:putative nucleotidyltransferase with HDIG domain